jgi:hypothetical protein
MLLYLLAAIGALTVAVVLLVLILMFFGWLGQSVIYRAGPDEIQRYLRSWGGAIADGGRILVRQRNSDRSIAFVKRRYKRSGAHLVFRFRNADDGRKYFDEVESALRKASIGFEMERTPTGRARAIVIPFPLTDDPLTLSAAAHVTRVALTAMGTPDAGPFEMSCTARQDPEYVRGSSEVIPWTRGYRIGVQLAYVLGRFKEPGERG